MKVIFTGEGFGHVILSRSIHRRTRVALAAFGRASSGSIAVQFAFLIPVMLLVTGNVIDIAVIKLQEEELQRVTDQAAIAAAKEFTIAGQEEGLTARAEAAVDTAYAQWSAETRFNTSVSKDVEVSTKKQNVKVTAAQKPKSFFGLGYGKVVDEISVTAVATVFGDMKVCVVGLNPFLPDVVSLTPGSQLTANECSVYANSSSSAGLHAMPSAKLKAELICTAGGYGGSTSAYEPEPTVDCPQISDPLEGREAPEIESCDNILPTVILNQTVTLTPGVYCLGLTIAGNSHVTLEPGIYVIKNGPFIVKDTATMIGNGVSFHLSGVLTTYHFWENSTIRLTAPETGPLAGILIFEDRESPTLGIHTITSRNARLLLGTIYLPNSTFHVDANGPVADESAYTAIVAKQVILESGPNLVLNSDYGATSVPLPQGISSIGQSVALTK